jgi:hypothetical protein
MAPAPGRLLRSLPSRGRSPGKPARNVNSGTVMLELRFPPPHLTDDRYLADVRQIIAEVLETQRQRGNRAGNQAIIDKIGLEARFVQGEGYWGEALDYHLGLLYAHIGEPEKAAYHFDRSGTLPSGGGDLAFSDHQRASLELRRLQDLAKRRGIPSLLIASMPRSASTSLTQTLAAKLDAPLMRVSCGQIPSYFLVPRWLNCFSPGGAVLHDHFGAVPFNLMALRAGGCRQVFVRVRDPRPAAASMAKLINRRFGALAHIDFESQVVELCEQYFIPWIADWLAAAGDAGSGLKIHWLAQPSSAIADMARDVLTVLAPENPALEQYLGKPVAEVRANYATGDEEAWRKGISKSAQERLWHAIMPNVKDFLALRP